MLLFYRCEGFVHTSIPHGNFAVQEMARKTGAFTVDLADSYDVFNEENLKQYDCILLNSTTGMVFPKAEQQNAFLDFVAQGKGLAGFHAASDNFGRHPECRALVGGEFGGHPWTAGGTWAFKLDDPLHNSIAPLMARGFGTATRSTNTKRTAFRVRKYYACWLVSIWTSLKFQSKSRMALARCPYHGFVARETVACSTRISGIVKKPLPTPQSSDTCWTAFNTHWAIWPLTTHPPPRLASRNPRELPKKPTRVEKRSLSSSRQEPLIVSGRVRPSSGDQSRCSLLHQKPGRAALSVGGGGGNCSDGLGAASDCW